MILAVFPEDLIDAEARAFECLIREGERLYRVPVKDARPAAWVVTDRSGLAPSINGTLVAEIVSIEEG